MRREARKAALREVGAAPSFKAVKKKSSRRSPLRRSLIAASVLAVVFALSLAAPKAAVAAAPDTPEIDPGSMAGAMTLLVGGVLALTDRNRRS
jgi:hypothetical protein